MKNLLSFLVLIILFSSCKKMYPTVGKSSMEDYDRYYKSVSVKPENQANNKEFTPVSINENITEEVGSPQVDSVESTVLELPQKATRAKRNKVKELLFSTPLDSPKDTVIQSNDNLKQQPTTNDKTTTTDTDEIGIASVVLGVIGIIALFINPVVGVLLGLFAFITGVSNSLARSKMKKVSIFGTIGAMLGVLNWVGLFVYFLYLLNTSW